ncbi:hypothetical protein X777_14441 [Ooceraea biroi]|uniref:Uncharacterized protein n=1 Tax=Ooceraea biroi TaxID=2015173 RepID=A0A026VW22_OOCBI|nr:hypothetical protein X777_14441 [Ooceraea biroi]
MNSLYRGIICIVQSRCASLVLSIYTSNNISRTFHNESPLSTAVQPAARLLGCRRLRQPICKFTRGPCLCLYINASLVFNYS